MILTCPECATSYFVDDTRIPPQGRRVKCSSCGHRWLTGPEGPIAEAPPALAAAPESFAEAPQAAAPEDDLDVVPAEPAATTVRRALAARPRDENRSSALIWAGAAALAAALIAGVIVFREQVVRLWPASSAAYAGLGLAVDGGGLVLEQVRVQPAFLAGRPVLSVTGAIRNLRDQPVDAPPIRVTLLNRAGKPVAAKIARPMDATVPARARRHFAIAILDPPSTARDLEVRFESAADGKAPPRAAEAVLAPAPPLTPGALPVPAATPEPPLSPAAATEHG